MKLSTGDVKGIPLMSIPRALLAFVQKSQSNQITDADLALKQNPEQMQSILPITIPAKHQINPEALSDQFWQLPTPLKTAFLSLAGG